VNRETSLPPEALADPVLRRVHEYWVAKSPPGGLPSRAVVDPIDLGPLLPHLGLVDVILEPPPFRLRFRLCGEVMVRLAGANPTGKYYDEFFEPDALATLRAEVERVITSGQPSFVERRAMRPTRDFARYRRLMLPLAADGRTIDMLLMVYVLAAPEPHG